MNNNSLQNQVHWHPAFTAAMQIELKDFEESLLFEEEHPLNSKPFQIDLLVIKKKDNITIEKNIGRIFRKYNIVEYKGATDYLSVDDFYKVNGYGCLYKALSQKMNGIKTDQITITFVCHGYPRELLKHLKKVCCYQIEEIEKGIFYIRGGLFVTQLIVTSRLSNEQNLWLSCLTNRLSQMEKERLAREYEEHRKNYLYKTVMNVIVRANKEKFKEARRDMCEALRELWRDEWADDIKEAKEQAILEGRREGLEVGLEAGLEAGREEGLAAGRAEGRVAGLAEGRAEGRAEGMQLFILDNLEEGKTRECIIEKLERRFGVSREKAEQEVDEIVKTA